MIVRPARTDDAAALAMLLNDIVEAGGTTAIEGPLPVTTFRVWFLDGPAVLCCFVAVDQDRCLGFQALGRHPELPSDWADIATFASMRRRGVGRALFCATLAEAARLGIAAINATIRADNAGGLAYYERLGFETYAVRPAVPLADGTPVDRISKCRAVPESGGV